jgi:Icc-related predicted phosphoesterase
VAGHFILYASNHFPAVKFVAISDTHCRHRSLRLPKGDVLLHAGDISYRSSRQEIEDFLDWFGKQPFAHKVFIAGNHDFFFEREKDTLIRSLLPEGVHYLKEEACTINGINIWGSPYTPWVFRWAFNQRRGAPLAKHWSLIPPNTDVLLTHGPVYGILDTIINERHAGDLDLLKQVMLIKPKVHVCGHIHESYGTLKRHGIRFINACMLNEAYELTNKPITFELLPSPSSMPIPTGSAY